MTEKQHTYRSAAQPEPAPQRGRRNVQDYVIQSLRERAEVGIQKYGGPLETFNGRDPIMDAFQEALDLANYLGQAVLENRGGAGAVASPVESKPWMEIAFSQYGTKEIAGPADNPDVVAYLETVGLRQANDETAWCSAFVNWIMLRAGYAGTNSAAARSWNSYGESITGPAYGAIAVLWRGSPTSWKGHVGFVVRWSSNRVWLLGGNQADEVNITAYPMSRVLGYRMPPAAGGGEG